MQLNISEIMNICLLGLSGSGKTCYLYTAAHVLKRGIEIGGHTISATSCDRIQTIRLNKGIEEMGYRKWPENSIETIAYPFELRIDGCPVLPFTIHDFRGHILEGVSDNDQKDFNSLFNTFENAGCIILFVDGDTLLDALDPSKVSPEHRRNTDVGPRLEAVNKLNYIESLVKECNNRMKKNVPVMLAITKSDIFYAEELSAGKELLKSMLPSLFSSRNGMTVAITDVTLGQNLQNEKGTIYGTLCFNTDGNVHLPILFALFQELEDVSNVDIRDMRNMIQELFSFDKINFYIGGKPAYIM